MGLESPQLDKESLEQKPLAEMSREEFADYLALHGKEYLKMTDRNLMQMAIDYDYADYIYDVLVLRPQYRALESKKVNRVSNVRPSNNPYEKNTRLIQKKWSMAPESPSGQYKFLGTNVTDAWLRWEFKGHTHGKPKTEKAYITLEDPARDMKPEAIDAVLAALEKAGFAGQVKMPHQRRYVITHFDNIVIHTEGDANSAAKALAVAVDALKKSGAVVEATDFGADERGVSHTQLLARKVLEAWKSPKKLSTEKIAGVHVVRQDRVMETPKPLLSDLEKAQAQEKEKSREVATSMALQADRGNLMAQQFLAAYLGIVDESGEKAKEAADAADKRSSEHRIKELEFEISRMRADIQRLSDLAKGGDGFGDFIKENGFDNDSAATYINNRAKINEDRIRDLESIRSAPEPKTAPAPMEVRAVAEIGELEKQKKSIASVIANPQKVNQIAQILGTGSENVVVVLQGNVSDIDINIDRYRRVAAGDPAALKEEKEKEAEEKVAGLERPLDPTTMKEADPAKPADPENLKDKPIGAEAAKAARVAGNLEANVLATQERAHTPDQRSRFRNWGWWKERFKGVGTLSFWEFHRAEQFRSSTKEVSKNVAHAGEDIEKILHLNEADSWDEAEKIQLILEAQGIDKPGAKDYERASDLVSQAKLERNEERMGHIVASATEELERRLAKYRDEFGDRVILDEAKINALKGRLKSELRTLQDGCVEKNAKAFKAIIRRELDPTYWRRYIYGGVELAGLATLGWYFLTPPPGPITPPVVPTVPGGPLMMHMHNTVWETSRIFLQQHGVAHPTTQQLMQFAKQVCVDNGIGVDKWSIAGKPLDVIMQQGHMLKFGGALKLFNVLRMAGGI